MHACTASGSRIIANVPGMVVNTAPRTVPRQVRMPRANRVANILSVVIPFAAILIAPILLWGNGFGWSDLAAFVVMYLITGFGVTVGFHRLLTHRAFASPTLVERAFAVAGSMAVEGPVISWVADHRKHHAHSDVEGDPHSPHLSSSPLRGLWHAHVGWLWRTNGMARRRKYAKDLMEDPSMRRIDRAFPALVGLSLLLPALIGFAIDGTVGAALTALIWGGLVRIFFIHHVTWSVNSICHVFGKRRFEVDDESSNVAWLALPSLGESWHHNHHAFPRSASHGLRSTELDPSAWLIGGLERVGLATNVVRIGAESQEAKEMARVESSGQ